MLNGNSSQWDFWHARKRKEVLILEINWVSFLCFICLYDDMEHLHGLLYSADKEMHFSSLQNSWEVLSPAQHTQIAELSSRSDRHHVQRTMVGEPDFHYKLMLIRSKPHIIYYMGNLDLLHQPILGIVGPRDHSPYATQILQKLFASAQQYQIVTISWLAPWVDQMCHRLSLQHHIPTIAVLWWGLKYFLDTADRKLISDIVAQGGLVISEFKLPMKPEHYTYPQRNRIIAGLSDVLFLPEAGIGSGSLITANFALEMSKPVYGVANTIFADKSAGINVLISQWQVKMVVDIDRFLSSCFHKKDPFHSSLPPIIDLSEDEKKIFSFIAERQTCTLSDLARDWDYTSQELISHLTFLEMKNCIYQESPGIYRVV